MAHRNAIIHTDRIELKGMPPASRIASLAISANSVNAHVQAQYRYRITYRNKWLVHVMDIFTCPVA